MRSVTVSLAPGIDGALGGPSTGLAVTFLNAASAALSGSVGRRPPGGRGIVALRRFAESVTLSLEHRTRKWIPLSGPMLIPLSGGSPQTEPALEQLALLVLVAGARLRGLAF